MKFYYNYTMKQVSLKIKYAIDRQKILFILYKSKGRQ